MGLLYDAGAVPGIGATQTAAFRKVLLTGDGVLYLAGGGRLDGTKSSDPSNTNDAGNAMPTVLQGGILLGKVTSTGKYATSVIDVLQAATLGGATSFKLTPAGAAELLRRIGSSGNCTITGAPTASGVVVLTIVAFTSINVTSGVVQCTAITPAITAGAFVGDTDGSATPTTLLAKEDGMFVVDQWGNRQDKELPWIPVLAQINTDGIVNYPAAANTTLVAWLQSALRANAMGLVFGSTGSSLEWQGPTNAEPGL
jgi:hypothetical protein